MTHSTTKLKLAYFTTRALGLSALSLPMTVGAIALLTSSCTTEVVNHIAAAPEQRGIVATGSGKIVSAPDIAVINIGVETWGEEPKAAVDENTKQTTLLVEALKKLGIAPADLQTSNFSIRFERREQPPLWATPQAAPAAALPKSAPANKSVAMPAVETPTPPPSKRDGSFVVNNTLHVTVRDLTKLGEALSSSTEAGANTIWGVEFRIDKPEPLIAQARDQAVADALAKAKRMAEVSGVKLGALVSIEEGAHPTPVPAPGVFYAKMASVPVEAGTMEVSADVTLRFSLE